MQYDHLLPIFAQDAKVPFGNNMPAGGLGLTMKETGIVMSVNGVIALFVQGFVFPLLASWLGVWRLFIMVTVGHPIAYLIVPYLVLLPPQHVYLGLYTCLFVRNFFSIVSYPLLLILIKEASPSPSHLGKINGLAASTGGACRTIASPVAGLLYGMGSKMQFNALPWWCSALAAVIGALQIPWIDRQKNKCTEVRTVAAWADEEEIDPQTKSASVRVTEILVH
jgi:hypothetical protein